MMRSTRLNPNASLQKLSHRLMLGMTLCVFGGFVLVGCTQDPVITTQPESVSMPPSIQPEDEGEHVVRINATQAAELDIQTATVNASPIQFIIAMPGSVFPAPDHIAIVSAPINGRIEQIYAHEGEAVRKGQVLATLESLEFATLAANYLKAKADQIYGMQQLERLEMLVDKKISPVSELQRANAELQRADASVRAVTAQLKTLGIMDSQLDAWENGEDSRPLLALRAPISGTMDEHLIDLGQAVTAYEKVLSIVNLERVKAIGYLAPEEAPLIAVGDSVFIETEGMAGRKVAGQVASINPALDEDSKSVVVNALINTKGGWPVPGQRIDISVTVTSPVPVLSVPIDALQYEGGSAVVYVSTDAQTFEKRVVEVDRVTADVAIIGSGLIEGEEVVVSQVFSLKALDRYDKYSE